MKFTHLFKRKSKSTKLSNMECGMYYRYDNVKHLLPKYGVYDEPIVINYPFKYGQKSEIDTVISMVYDALETVKLKDGTTLKDHLTVDDFTVSYEDYFFTLYGEYLYLRAIGKIVFCPTGLPYWFEFNISTENECDDRKDMPDSQPYLEIPRWLIHYRNEEKGCLIVNKPFVWEYEGPEPSLAEIGENLW